MRYLRTRRLVLVLAAILLTAAIVFAWVRNRGMTDSGLHLHQREISVVEGVHV